MAALADHLLTIPQTAETLGVSTNTVKRRVADGSLPAYHVGGGRSVRIKRSDLDALLRPVPVPTTGRLVGTR